MLLDPKLFTNSEGGVCMLIIIISQGVLVSPEEEHWCEGLPDSVWKSPCQMNLKNDIQPNEDASILRYDNVNLVIISRIIFPHIKNTII